MYQQPVQFVSPDPLLGIFSDADPRAMDALAAYFEYQARRLRMEADAVRQRARAARDSRLYRERAKTRFMKIGARTAVLARRHGDDTAICEIAQRETMALEQVRFALARWRKFKAKQRAPHQSAR